MIWVNVAKKILSCISGDITEDQLNFLRGYITREYLQNNGYSSLEQWATLRKFKNLKIKDFIYKDKKIFIECDHYDEYNSESFFLLFVFKDGKLAEFTELSPIDEGIINGKGKQGGFN